MKDYRNRLNKSDKFEKSVGELICSSSESED